MNTVGKGSIVKVSNPSKDEQGYYKVTSLRGGKANLGSIFGKGIYHKGVLAERLTECHDEWYEAWSKTETYMCM